jgi:HK97 family phage major capsid protein
MSGIPARAIERKDDNGNQPNVAKAVESVMGAFEEFKATNDARIKEIEKKGSSDPLVSEKLARIESTLSAYEDINQKLTQAEGKVKALEGVKEQLDELATAFNRTAREGGEGKRDVKEAEYKDAFRAYLRDPNGIKDEQKAVLLERKALIAGNDSLGGYYLAPGQMATEIIKAVIEMSPMRSIATVSSISVKSLILPKRTGTFAATRTGETQARTETVGYTTGQVEIVCPEMYAKTFISEQMIEDAAFNVEAEMGMEFAEQFGVKEGAEFVSGSGAENQAQGFLNAAGVLSTNSGSATLMTADGLIALQHAIKTAYAQRATWVLNRATLGGVRQLKDGDDRYVWTPGIAGASPNTILGAPYVEMPDMPNVTAGSTPVAFGDFRRAYRIVDRVMISVLRDPYTEASNGMIKYLARKRVGGAVTLAEAVRKLTIAS